MKGGEERISVKEREEGRKSVGRGATESGRVKENNEEAR